MFSGKNLFPAVLVVGLMVSGLVSAVCVVLVSRGMGELRGLQAQVEQVQNSRQLVQELAIAAVEYSKRNPAITPVLQAAGINVSPAAAPKVGK